MQKAFFSAPSGRAMASLIRITQQSLTFRPNQSQLMDNVLIPTR